MNNNGHRWVSTSNGAALADHTGRIVGSVRRLNNDGHFATSSGYSYIDIEHAKRAMEEQHGVSTTFVPGQHNGTLAVQPGLHATLPEAETFRQEMWDALNKPGKGTYQCQPTSQEGTPLPVKNDGPSTPQEPADATPTQLQCGGLTSLGTACGKCVKCQREQLASQVVWRGLAPEPNTAPSSCPGANGEGTTTLSSVAAAGALHHNV